MAFCVDSVEFYFSLYDIRLISPVSKNCMKASYFEFKGCKKLQVAKVPQNFGDIIL